jgi:hypothetical protein
MRCSMRCIAPVSKSGKLQAPAAESVELAPAAESVELDLAAESVELAPAAESAREWILRRDYEKPTSVRMPAELAAYIKVYAQTQHRSVSWVIVDVVRKWMDWDKKQRYKKVVREDEDDEV